jgi:DNA-binding transcriptional LysR family regulator
LDIELLRTFIEVNRTGHFGRAADKLFLTQSAVSARIKMLEDTLGVTLFERKRNDIRLTSSGNRFLRHARSIVESWQRARQDVALEEGFVSSLAIGSLVDLWELDLLDWLILLRRQLPEIAFHASALPFETLTMQMLNGQLDLSIVFDNYFSLETESRFLRRMDLVMVSSADKLLEQVFDADYIMVNWGTAFAQTHAQSFPEAHFVPLYLSHGSLALHYILREKGAAYLPRQWVQPYLDEGRLFLIGDAPVIEREIFAVWRHDNERQSVIREVLQNIADSLPV